ncbi:phospholipase D family protein [Adhaeribacter sp. BT258]|uniref:Phospholipase D family protein n=1 Tax=Adhaeribacter terrigena TaxID=2793070 RepID=A0ABS1C5Z5_9BACT|nr:phospholipase D family protein [Adhaeribacter terrigena]MBK0404646.1 phospholipase D family protein [Adhaeribacter terrigena]
MAKFITGRDLETAVDKIIWDAENQLIIVSPYIKLDEHFKKLFDKHLNNPKLHIKIIFGKNEGQVNKSFNKNDLEYFKKFQNISIIYIQNLHAKYYANEIYGIVTSINLYDYSFKHNIEFGVLYENNILNKLSKNTDIAVWNYAHDIADIYDVIYVKRPVYQKKNFGLTKDYINSKVLFDCTEELYRGRSLTKSYKKLSDYEGELDHKTEFSERPSRQEDKPIRAIVKPQFVKSISETTTTYSVQLIEPGYCIRTGEKIPFNPDRPFSYQSFQSWNQFGNENYPERFCHYSGEPSYGETSYSRPILNKNWKKAQQLARI